MSATDERMKYVTSKDWESIDLLREKNLKHLKKTLSEKIKKVKCGCCGGAFDKIDYVEEEYFFVFFDCYNHCKELKDQPFNISNTLKRP